jgi:phenylacetate-CoA ligase
MNSLKNTILKRMILPVGDLVFGQRMMSRLKFLENAQWWEPDRITNWQNNELQKLIQVAYNEVPFYRQLFDSASVRPEEIQSAKELSRIPIVTKDMLRKGYPTLTTRKTGQRTYEVGTSGSTGKNFFVREDAYTAGWYRATLLLALEWSGWHVGEPQLQTGITPQRSMDRQLKDWLLSCHYVSAYTLDDKSLDKMLATIERYRLKYLWGYPGSLYLLAKQAKKRGWNQQIKSVVTWGDMLYSNYRHEIESVFQTHVFDTYGCSEGFHIAAQCGTSQNYHLHNFDVIVEFVDEYNQPVKPGTPGGVIVTRLHPGPMPFIRYRVGDVATASTNVCTCGRGLTLLANINGRDTDYIITPGGNRLIVHFFTGILEHFPEIDSFQVVQEEINAIHLNIVPRSQVNESTKLRIISELKKRGTDELRIDIHFVSEIPLTKAGKRRFVINKMEQV